MVSAVRTPPRWKQAISIWLGFFPLNQLFSVNLYAIPALSELPLWVRVLIFTVLLTPIMTYIMLPFVTRLLGPWLRRPARGRSSQK